MKDILEKVNHNDGMTVPEGYFESFAARMEASLPVQPWEEKKPRVMPRSFWQKVRPYVYMAAMFAGVWCMMKMVDLIRTNSGLSVEQSNVMTAALSNEQFMDYYFMSQGEMSDYELMDDLYEDGYSPAALPMPDFYDVDSTLEI